jgi:hypothetical protein
VDKTFAPSLAAAKRMFAKAEQHGTPMISSSALRYGSALQKAVQEAAGKPVGYVGTRGPGDFATYSVHQVEMLVMLLGTGARRVMHCGNDRATVLVIDYPDGRRGTLTQFPNHPFQLSMQYGDGKSLVIDAMEDFFPRFIEAMLAFFDSGVPSVPKEETLEVAAVLEAGAAALKSPDTWVPVPK